MYVPSACTPTTRASSQSPRSLKLPITLSPARKTPASASAAASPSSLAGRTQLAGTCSSTSPSSGYSSVYVPSACTPTTRASSQSPRPLKFPSTLSPGWNAGRPGGGPGGRRPGGGFGGGPGGRRPGGGAGGGPSPGGGPGGGGAAGRTQLAGTCSSTSPSSVYSSVYVLSACTPTIRASSQSPRPLKFPSTLSPG